MSRLRLYAITFRDSGETIALDAWTYTISEGFVRLYRSNPNCSSWSEFAAYNSDNVIQIVEQIRYTPEEILQQIKQIEESK